MSSPITWIALAGAGAMGSVARFGIAKVLTQHFPGFAWGTLLVNVLGSLLLGYLASSVADSTSAQFLLPKSLQVPVCAGFLGAFTTFSTFSVETISFANQGQFGHAIANVVANLLLGLLAAWLGYTLANL